ncbi:glycosyltransferase family 9 protein [Vreelandella janggokensis]|uniref:glycosyltransferase family 9 protein n=1 Tax=Vreelandella janggokensis TaxID=370767 RepID=UPI0028634606|nr:glycosyltransferase family 9 protein [Halomonas janggokensis]MDR5885686.1 glycosyltransferase family 9 protein [Halomonas janggokensis]
MKICLISKCVVVFLHNRPFFGAYIVHIPFLAAIKEKYPNAVLVGVSKTLGAEFLLEAGFLDVLEVIENDDVSILRKKYDFDVGFNLRPSSIRTAFQMLKLRIPNRIGFRKFGALYTYSKKMNKSLYRSDLFLSLLDIPSSLDAEPYVREKIPYDKEMMGKIIVAPGAGGAEKKWPLLYYVELARRISLSGIGEILFLTGPQEVEEKDKLESLGFCVFHNPSVKVLFGLIGGCRLFISNDCGPSHIAHIYGVKQVVVFKKYLPEWFLERDNSLYLASEESISSITPADVWIAILKILN